MRKVWSSLPPPQEITWLISGKLRKFKLVVRKLTRLCHPCHLYIIFLLFFHFFFGKSTWYIIIFYAKTNTCLPTGPLLIPHTNINCFYPIMAGVSALMQATYCWIKERTVSESKTEPAHFNTGHLARESENYLANKQTVQRHGAWVGALAPVGKSCCNKYKVSWGLTKALLSNVKNKPNNNGLDFI